MRASLRALLNLVRVALAPLWLASRLFARPKSPWVELRLASRLRELKTPAPLWQRVLPQAQRRLAATSLEDVRDLVRMMAGDASVQGLLVHLPSLEAGWAACESLRQAFSSLRSAGKQVICYLPEGAGSRELYVALAGQRIAVSPHSSVAPLGLASSPLYVKRLLDRLGVEVQAQATGEYKSAAEPALRESMSEAAREQLTALLGTMHEALATALGERPGMDAARVAAVFAKGMMTAAQARELGVLDELVYEDELPRLLGLEASTGAAQAKPSAPTSAARYLRYGRMRFWQPVRAEPYVAVVPVRGTIVTEGLGIGRASAELATIVTSLRETLVDPLARAVVLYVNSPGGSALASDLIHREVERLAARKPVVAYFGDVAASGGYYVAAPCARIVAQSVSITGSIGVISVKGAIGGLLERIGLRAEVVKTAEHADMFSYARKLSPDEEQNLAEHTRALYGRFLEVVATGRKRSVDEIEPLARGRVWSGRDALANGLVDVLGGFDRAVDEARSLVTGLTSEQRAKLHAHVHVPRSPEPPPPRALALPSALAQLLPDDLALVPVLLRGEHALYYAPATQQRVR